MKPLSSSRFPYQPLDEPDSIRLLQLHPASSNQAEVRCSLTKATLALCADIYDHYTALSYVWGDPNITKTIWVNETPFLITINLYSALRDIPHERVSLQLWTDAICINRHDDEEKLKQIAMMGKIYSTASQTAIYLGSLETQDESAVNSWASINPDVWSFSPEVTNLLFHSTWFQRVWVFQELVFSKDPRVQLGRHRFPWSALLAWTSKWPSKLIIEMNRARELHQESERPHMRVSGSELSQDIVRKRSELMMIDLLRARRGLGVTNPKDMIFAHLGFASDGPDLGRKINYSMNYA